MENQFSKKVGVKNGIIYTAIQKKAYPDYVERVNNAFVQAASADGYIFFLRRGPDVRGFGNVGDPLRMGLTRSGSRTGELIKTLKLNRYEEESLAFSADCCSFVGGSRSTGSTDRRCDSRYFRDRYGQ